MSARLFWLIFLIVFVVGGAHAQAVPGARFSAERTQWLIGEPLELTLTIVVPEMATVTLPAFPAQWAAFVVLEAGSATETVNSELRTVQQTLRVLLWQTGEFVTPDTVVTYQLPGDSAPVELQVETAVITVNSILQPDDLVLRPLRAPHALPYLAWWVIVLLIAACGVGVYAGVCYLRGRRSARTWQLDDNSHPALRAALRRIDALTVDGVVAGSAYVDAAESLRQYVEERFGIAAADMTTGELLARLEVVNAQRRHELRNMLERADLVKFARAQARSAAAQQYVAAVRRWVLTVEADIQADGP
jgi:hypothetical protein